MGRLKYKSFTLIELVVAVGVIGIVLPPIFNIFFTLIRQQLVLVSYQEMNQQGNSAQRNIKNIVQNRAAYITDSTYTATDVCPVVLITTPTPTYSPDLYIKDREGVNIRLYLSADTIASFSANRAADPFELTSAGVSVSNLGFSCSRTSEFALPVVSTQFTVNKSTVFKDVSLPYTFNTKLSDY